MELVNGEIISRPDGLTDEEGEIMDLLNKAWLSFIKLERQHPSELGDFTSGIHMCQRLLGMRVLRREHPEGWPNKGHLSKIVSDLISNYSDIIIK